MLVSFQHVLYAAIVHKTRHLPITLLYQERVVNDITCHRNLEATYLKDLQEREGSEFLEDYCPNSVSLLFQNLDTHLGLNISVMLTMDH
jgi:hypothetical protein